MDTMPLFERVLELEKGTEVKLLFFEPYLSEKGWKSRYVLVWPGKRKREFVARGADKLQSFIFCIRAAEAFLKSNQEWKNGQLKWFGDSDLGLFQNNE